MGGIVNSRRHYSRLALLPLHRAVNEPLYRSLIF